MYLAIHLRADAGGLRITWRLASTVTSLGMLSCVGCFTESINQGARRPSLRWRTVACRLRDQAVTARALGALCTGQ